MCLEIYELDPVCFLFAPGLAQQAALKQNKLKLDLLTDIDMLLLVEKFIRVGICYGICHQYVKANNKGMKEYGKSKESSYFKYWYINNLYELAISFKFPVNDFRWV